MRHAAAAAVHLTNHQLFSGRRLLVTLASVLGPVLLVAVAALMPRGFGLPPSAEEGYRDTLAGVYIGVIVPFLGIYWGSALFSDELEGRTLVFLWTRPSGRAWIFIVKYLVACLWLAVLLVPSVLGVFVIYFGRVGFGDLVRNLPMVGWDLRSLVVGGTAYMALGFLLSALTKKPLILGLAYVFLWDSFAFFLPGFLKLFSIRHYMLVLGSNPHAGAPTGFFAFLAQSETTEFQSMVTLGCFVVVALLLAVFLLKKREYLGDDPARAQ